MTPARSRFAGWLRRTWHGDPDSDSEEGFRHQKACLVSIAAVMVGVPVGLLGAGRTYEVVSKLIYGADVSGALLGLAIRPVALTGWLIVVTMQTAFLAWQIAAYRLRALLLLLPGALAALLIPAYVLLNSYMSSVVHCACMPFAWSGWFDFAIAAGILVLASWVFGRLGAFLVRPPPLPLTTARLAAFAWTNGGLILLCSQLAFLYGRFGSGVFR